jgi:hypothetical protein
MHVRTGRSKTFFVMPAAVAVVLLFLGTASGSLPTTYYKECIPDFSQHQDHWVDKPGEPSFCGPTSAANSLFWMSREYNLPKLRQRADGTPYNDNAEMIEDIASYMGFVDKTTYYDPPGGVSDEDFIKGKRAYIDDRYPSVVQKHKRAKLQWDKNDIITKVTDAPPTLYWIMSELYKCHDVEIRVSHLEEVTPGVYKRTGGHWMTVVGWNETELCVHDPARNNDPEPVLKNYPGTGFDHEAHDDCYTYTWVEVAKTGFDALEYKDGAISIIDCAVSEAVPEPTTMILVAVGALAGVLVRRRKG